MRDHKAQRLEDYEEVSGSELRWFRSLFEVPGLTWSAETPPPPDRRLAGARPVRERAPVYGSGLAWVDEDDVPLAEFISTRSPAQTVLLSRWDTDDRESASEATASLVFGCLALPGTAADYVDVLSELVRVMPSGSAVVWNAACALAHLLTTEAQADPGSLAERARREPTGGPIQELMDRYVGEGFLRDALELEDLLDGLPHVAQVHFDFVRPSAVSESLDRLRYG